MKKINTILGFACLLLFLSGSVILFVSSTPNALPRNIIEKELLSAGSDAMDWTLTEIRSGQNMTFSDFAGKIIILNFWEIQATSFETAIAMYKQIKTEYSSSQIAIVSLNINPISDSKPEIIDFIEEYDLSWYIFSDTEGVYLYYEISLLPTTVIINQNQKVHYNIVGVENLYTVLKQEIDSLIESPPTSENNGGTPLSEFWQKNWYWFLIGSIFIIILAAVLIQRRRVVVHNRKVREQKLEARERRARKR